LEASINPSIIKQAMFGFGASGWSIQYSRKTSLFRSGK
jgi:hypothetical protein